MTDYETISRLHGDTDGIRWVYQPVESKPEPSRFMRGFLFALLFCVPIWGLLILALRAWWRQ